MKRFASSVVIAMAVSMPCIGSVWAQDYPSKPIRVVHTQPAGGAIDIEARHLATNLQKHLNVSVFVEGRPGGENTIGMDIVRKSPPDGYTIGVFLATAASSTFVKDLPFDVLTSFEPIAAMDIRRSFVAISTAIPAKTLAEFIAHAKANPGKLNAGVNAGQIVVVMNLFKKLAGIEIANINYAGGPAGPLALSRNEVQITFGGYPVFSPHVQAGRAIVVAIAGDQRDRNYPQIPTMIEQGYKVKVQLIVAAMGPAGLPQAVTSKLVPIILETSNSPEFLKIGGSGVPANWHGEQLRSAIKEELEFYADAARQTGYKPE